MSKLYVDELHPKTTGGAVKRPSVPAWRISLDSDKSITVLGQQTVEWDKTDDDDVEKTFMNNVTLDSSYRIVVPVAGFYQINAIIRFDQVGSGYINVMIDPDSSSDSIPRSYGIVGQPSTNYHTISLSDVFKLNAGSTLQVLVVTQSDSSYVIDERSNFSGFLIG